MPLIRRSAALAAALLFVFASVPAGAAAADQPPGYPADYELPNGHFYTQTNAGTKDPTAGFSVTDEASIPLWSQFQQLGGVPAIGYPISGRFQLGAYIVQGFQKAILQWQPDAGRAVRLNVMDMLHDAGKDAALQADHLIPPQSAGDGDRLKLLDFPNDAFKAAYASVPDPMAGFGVPTSPIVDEGPSYTIRLQRTAMQLWKKDEPWAKANTVTFVNAGDLAKEQGLIPAAAAKPEPGRLVAGQADVTPWSGWWWPSLSAGDGGPHVFDRNGPLDKYDGLVEKLTGTDPQTQQWELAHFQFFDPALDWAGKCNGWAVAALTEPEPVAPVTVDGITFSVADQKGLLADYHFADPAAWLIGDKEGGVKAADFHKTLLDWVGRQHKGLVMNAFDGTQQVASFAVFRFQAVYLPDPADPVNKTHVRMTVWAADYHVDPNFVGLKIWPDDKAKTYSYVIYGDRTNPTAGDWEGDSVSGPFAHPQNLWYPDTRPESRNLFGELTSPALDYNVIQRILKGSA